MNLYNDVPKISVAICTYNGANYLDEQLNSILNQTVPIYEIIVCDDGSTDNTLEIIKSFEGKYPDINWLVVENPSGKGVVKNFHRAILLTKGDIIFLSDQDDIWNPNKVERFLDYFSRNPKILLAFSNATLIDERSNLITGNLWEKVYFTKKNQSRWQDQRNAFSDLFYNENHITGAAAAFRSSLKATKMPFLTAVGYYHDAILGLQAVAENGLGFFDEKLISYRIHANQQLGIGNGVNYKRAPRQTAEMGYMSIAEYRWRVFLKYPVLTISGIFIHYTKSLVNKIRRQKILSL